MEGEFHGSVCSFSHLFEKHYFVIGQYRQEKVCTKTSKTHRQTWGVGGVGGMHAPMYGTYVPETERRRDFRGPLQAGGSEFGFGL